MPTPRLLRPAAVALALAAAVLTGCGGESEADPESLQRLDALNARIDSLEERVAELQDAADAAEAEPAADDETDAEADG